MVTIEEMKKWNYETAWKFFTEKAFRQYIPETEYYIRASENCITQDLREDKFARKKILESLSNKKSLILIDGSSLNGKTTFAYRLLKKVNGSIVDIDLICKDWIEEQFSKKTNPIEQFSFMQKVDYLSDLYIIENLENIIKEKCMKGNVILVGCYMELVYRTIIARTLGKYFDQVISIYFCAKTPDIVLKLKEKRDKEFGFSAESEENILKQYEYSKSLVDFNHGIVLGFGMTKSFISDITVSNMFEQK